VGSVSINPTSPINYEVNPKVLFNSINNIKCLIKDVLYCILRQMRNRDSAKSSRDRKKQYIKDLEMKTRFLESECKRLNYSLQCFISENMALRQTLHSKEIAAGKNKKPHRADVAMRESAVLFLGELIKHKYLSYAFYVLFYTYGCSYRDPLGL
jgi:Basic region leucine zipper